MVSYEIGRVCLKLSGREAGKYCVVLKKENKSFVLVTGPKMLTGVKRRKANLEHLEPTRYIIEVPESGSDEMVIEGYQKAGLLAKLGLKKPSAAEVKSERAKTPKEAKPEKKPEDKKKEEKEAKEAKEKDKKAKKK